MNRNVEFVCGIWFAYLTPFEATNIEFDWSDIWISIGVRHATQCITIIFPPSNSTEWNAQLDRKCASSFFSRSYFSFNFEVTCYFMGSVLSVKNCYFMCFVLSKCGLWTNLYRIFQTGASFLTSNQLITKGCLSPKFQLNKVHDDDEIICFFTFCVCVPVFDICAKQAVRL